MQGKIAVEEHFALPETAAKSVRHPDDPYWSGIHGKLIDLFDRRLAEMDKAGIEIAVLSLNANGCRKFPRPPKRSRSRSKPMTHSLKRWQSGPTASPPWPRCQCRTRKRRPLNCNAASAVSNSKARWSTVFRKSASPTPRSITTYRNTGRSGPKPKGLACRFICIRVIRCLASAGPMRAILGLPARRGTLPSKPRSMRCA
jgi:hypothetical protein